MLSKLMFFKKKKEEQKATCESQNTKEGRTQGKTAQKNNRKTDYCASGVDEPTLLSFLVHSQQREKRLS